MVRACGFVLLLACVPALADSPATLPGTRPLTEGGDLSERMLDGLHRFVERKVDGSVGGRASLWKRDPSSRETYERSIRANREWFYRQAYQMGRHVIGYELQKVLAAVDWMKDRAGPDLKVGVAGYGEGGLLAFYAAAADPRIDAALVSGYFGPRERVWAEPIYRNVWGLLREFGDAEVATLIAPRGLVVEHSVGPRVEGPPAVPKGRRGGAAGGGR